MSFISLPKFRLSIPSRPCDLLTGSGVILMFVGSLALSIVAQSTRSDNRDADRAAIRASIEGITQAYLDGNIEKIYGDRSADWTGFVGRAPIPIIGRDQYMQVQGLQYPPPANAPKREKDTSTIFRFTNFDVNFVSPDVAVVNFILEYAKRSDADFVPTSRMRITDVYGKRKGVWLQVASHTSADPNWRPPSN